MKMGNVLLVAGIVGALPMATWAAERTVATVDFSVSDGPKIRPELHSSGFGPQICSCPKEDLDAIRAMGFKASRTHDWALINPNERVCDWHMIFPLPNEDGRIRTYFIPEPQDDDPYAGAVRLPYGGDWYNCMASDVEALGLVMEVAK